MENSLKTDVSTLQQWFETAEDQTMTARQESERARDYFDGKQLSDAEIEALAKRGQPPVVFNRIRKKVEWLQGLEVKQRTDPKAFPRTPKHAEAAEAATDAIRYVADNTDWDEKRSGVYGDMLVEGFGGVEVLHEKRGDKVEIKINRYPWNRLFYDPHSREDDFSDARYLGAVIWMDQANFERDFPGIALPESPMNVGDTYDDKPDHWFDPKRKRVRLVLMWFREGEIWKWARFTKGAIIDSGDSPYRNELGESLCAFFLQSAYVGRNNERYGIVRDMFAPQDEINKRRSKALHTASSRQTMGVAGLFNSVSDLKAEMAQPDAHIEFSQEMLEWCAQAGIKPFDILPTGDQASAQFQLLQEAKQEIDGYGANSALEGDTGESASGRAVLARQQGGMIEIAALTDKLHRFTRRVYRMIWMLIRQFWTEERWVRVTDEERNARFVGLNRPITLQEQLGQMPQEQAQAIALQMGLHPSDPRLNQPVGIENNVAETDVDILIEEVPDRVTLEGEAFEALLRYAQAGQIPPAVLIEADPSLPVKKKEKLLEMMQQPPAPSPTEQLSMAETEAKIGETQAKTQKLQSEAAAAYPLAGIA